jgi:hypothetical protein
VFWRAKRAGDELAAMATEAEAARAKMVANLIFAIGRVLMCRFVGWVRVMEGRM